ncbi:EamA family transporter [Polaribacter sp. R2A056_3_33]|jgi:carboxylate/amino acid/amine transporter|uniref:EamA family transporter n=1 Tax=unclassified Polaribacter TaxID=196858 RepID=UPI001C4FE21A|nr:EamA family transporter [Polaribacter sp. R2A056_3_33]QXP70595.1 EamA family transporter [Polaribacter sp. R2A056_3_33]
MKYLFGVTMIWAFSFSLIGVYLSGFVDAWFSVLMRIGVATMLFLPFLKLKKIKVATIYKLIAIGSVQLGLMYCFYFQSFRFLTVPEVLLFSVLTPIYITLLNDFLSKKFHKRHLLTALIAVLGAAYIQYSSISENVFLGFMITQGANLCFAVGQIAYKYLLKSTPELKSTPKHTIFGLFFIGAFLVALIAFFIFGATEKLPTTSVQWGVLIYLGAVASGLGYFFWNKGVVMVNTGSLAIMNNALVPIGLIVNLVIWNKEADIQKILIGGSLIFASLALNEYLNKKNSSKSLLIKSIKTD